MQKEIESIVREVVAKSGPITNEYISDTMRRIRTLCVLNNAGPEVAGLVAKAREILAAAQARNSDERVTDVLTGATTAGHEDPRWKQRIDTLVFSLQHYGLDIAPGADRVRVHAALDMKYPIGGTPVQVLSRVVPERQDLKVGHKLANNIFNALGPKLSKFRFAGLIKSQAAQTSGFCHVTISRLEFIELVTLLFTNKEYGWKARGELLAQHGITEI